MTVKFLKIEGSRSYQVMRDEKYLGEIQVQAACRMDKRRPYSWSGAKGLFAPLGDHAAAREIDAIRYAELGTLAEAKATITEWVETHDHLIR